MPPRLEEIAHGPDKNEPAYNHEHVGQPLAARDTRDGARGRRRGSLARSHSGGRSAADRARVEVVRVGVLRLRIGVIGAASGGLALSGAHVEAVLHEGNAKAGSRPVLGGVRGVEEIGEQEADECEGHADHGVPDKGEEGADGEAFDVDFVRGARGDYKSGFPVWGRCVGCRGFVGLGGS